MKIDSSGKSIGSIQGNPRTAGAAAKPTPAPAETASSSTVVATSLHTVADSEPAFNAQRVAEIRQAISEGRFQINPEKIANGLINSVREMLAQDRRSA